MNNLPLLSAAPQAANPQASSSQPTAKPASANKPSQAATAAPAQATASEDATAPSQPFGDVLARQVADANSAEDASLAKAKKAAPVEDSADQLKADDVAKSAAAAGAAQPNDMLATLLPQGIVIQSENAADAKKLGKKTDQAEVDLPGLSKQPGQTPTLGKAESSVIQGAPAPRTAAPRTADITSAPATDAKKDAAFNSLLESMTAATTGKAIVAEDQADSLASAQANAATQAASQTASTAPANVLPAQITINAPVAARDKWGDEFNQKITWLASSKEQTAELHLNPPQLGPMDVVLKVSGDQATALFTSPHAEVRHAIEQALPKLREMMAESGIMLGQATVNDQAPRNPQDGNRSKSSGSRSGVQSIGATSAAGHLGARVSPIRQHNGIVDTFA